MSNALRSLPWFITLTCSALLAGCGGDSTESQDNELTGGNPSSLPDACALFSDTAPLKAIVGVEIAKSKKEDTSDRRCTWYGADDFALLGTFFTKDAGGFDALEPRSPAVPGLGADAYLGGNGALWVKTAGFVYMAQGLAPVADGVVSTEIQTAGAADSHSQQALLLDEAAFRLAKLLDEKL